MDKANGKKIIAVETIYGSFPCSFEPEKDMGGYVVEARGVQGALSWGKTLAEAKRMIREAIEGAIEAGIVAKVEKQGVFQIRSVGRHAVPVA
ncbi:MAG: type II toxin-antitoxin system HicB family antitoxin [Patescibacteria group bacterium]